jgi:hypothetical protein
MPEQSSGQGITGATLVPQGKRQQGSTQGNKGRLSSGVSPYTGTFTDDHLRHLLRRTLFGFRKTEFDAFKGMTASQVVDMLLNTSTTPPAPPVNNYNSTNYTDPNVPAEAPGSMLRLPMEQPMRSGTFPSRAGGWG